MSTPLDTLLEAARYIELQEKGGSLNIISSEIPTFAQLQFYDNGPLSHTKNTNKSVIGTTNIITKINNSRKNIQNNIQQYAVQSPQLSPDYNYMNDDIKRNHDTVNNNQQILVRSPGSIIPIKKPNDCLVANLGTSSSLIGAVTSTIGSISGIQNVIVASTTEDSSQSSLNLSSSGYLSGSSVNSSIGGSNLNLNASLGIVLQGNDNQNSLLSRRKRTTSMNSNGTQRSPCILRAGTREVHNKLEKHRRAHLKECFEQLKIQLQLKDEEKKKTSNLAILGAAYRHVILLRRKERELEQQVEQLAKEKINAQKKIVCLKRELSAKYDNIDFATIIADGDFGFIPGERAVETNTVSLLPGKGNIRYSSSNSISNGTTISSPLAVGITSGMSSAISPVISSFTSSNPSLKLSNIKSTCPINSTGYTPLSFTTKHVNFACGNAIMSKGSTSPTATLPSLSLGGVLSSVPFTTSSLSSSPIGIKIPKNFSNGIKLSNNNSSSINYNSIVTPSFGGNSIFSSVENEIIIPNTAITANLPLNFKSSINSRNLQINKNNQLNLIKSATKDTVDKVVSRKNSLIDDSKGLHNSTSRIVLSNCVEINGVNKSKDIKIVDPIHPAKVLKLINGTISVESVDKDNNLLSNTPLSLSQVVNGSGLVVSQFPIVSSQGLRVIGTSSIAGIELSAISTQSQFCNHSHQSTQSINSVTPATSAHMHKVLVNNGNTISSTSNSEDTFNFCNPNFTVAHVNNANSATSELAKLPGGSELNILPTGTNGTNTIFRSNGKLTIKNNNGGNTENNVCRAVHIVTSLQSTNNSNVVSKTQSGHNLTPVYASSNQKTEKINLSVGGQTYLSTQHRTSLKSVSGALAEQPTYSLNSLSQTSATVGNISGNILS